jgi:hypothetical protein
MNKWFNFLFTVLIAAGFRILFTYIYYTTLDPIGITVPIAIVFGVCMWVIELVFHKKKK